MSMFSCKACVEKDKRIGDLKDEITHLRQMVHPSATPVSVQVMQREVDSILSGEPVMVEHYNSVDNEASALLTGMYSSDQVDYE